MVHILRWLKKRFQTFDLLAEYFTAAAHHLQDILWGAALPFVVWGIWFIVASPPTWVNLSAIGVALFLAGYYVWRADHTRLMPRFSVTTLCPPNITATEDRDTTNLFIQIIPECLTDSPVRGCRARLLQVSKRFSDGDELSG